MSAKRLGDIGELELLILEFLRKEPERAHKMADLVHEIDEYAPVDLKIAALNLVSQGRAQLNPRWEIEFRGPRTAQFGRAVG